MKKADNHKIAAAIRAGNLPAYQRQRYPAIQDGEIVRFTSEDFSNVDFDKFAMWIFVVPRQLLRLKTVIFAA